MKKRLMFIVAIILMVVLASCGGKKEKVPTHQEVFESITIGYEDGDAISHVTKNIKLPSTYDHKSVTLSWVSANENILSSDGKVNRPQKNDAQVLLILEVIINGIKDEKNYLFTVIALEEVVEDVYYNVSFNTNGGTSIESVRIKENSVIERPNDPTKDNFIFMGWFKDSSLTQAWSFSSDTVKADITLYAKWKEKESEIETFTVTFNVDGGTPIDNQILDEGSLISKPTNPIKTDYTFDGWFKDSEHTQIWDFTKDVVNGNMTLYAKWTKDIPPVVYYRVTFNVNGGSTLQPVTVSENSLLEKPIDPVKEAYDFMGWFKDEGLTISWNFEEDKVVEDLTLYASWELSTVYYDVIFNTNGGSIVEKAVVEENTLLVKPEDPVRNAYVFDGWYKEESFENLFDFELEKITSNLTLHAKWRPVGANPDDVIYTVSFEVDGGNPVDSIYVIENHKLSELPIPTKEDYAFEGWYKEQTLENPWQLEVDLVTEDTTLYAKWRQLPPKLPAPIHGINLEPRPDALIAIGPYEFEEGDLGGFTGYAMVFTHLESEEVFIWRINHLYKAGFAAHYTESNLAEVGIVLPHGNYRFNYFAMGNNETTRDSDYSSQSTLFTIQKKKLDKPILNINQVTKELTWQPVEGADSYEVFIDEVLQEASTSPFSLTHLTEVGVYQIKVVVHGEDYLSNESEIQYIIENQEAPQLIEPTNFVLDSFILSWDEVLNSVGYVLTHDGISHTTSSNSFDLSIFDKGDQTILVTIVAKGDAINYLDSNETTFSAALPSLLPRLNAMTAGDHNGDINGYGGGHYRLLYHSDAPVFQQEDWSGTFRFILKQDGVYIGEKVIEGNAVFVHMPNNATDFYGSLLTNGETYTLEIILIAKEGSGHRDSLPLLVTFTFQF